jgi:pilus assembly protein CpaF
MNSNADLYRQIVARLQSETQIDIASLPRHSRDGLHDVFLRLKSEFAAQAKDLDFVRVENEIFHCGPLEPLLNDPDVTEILVNGHNSIWFEREGRLHRLTDCFFSPLSWLGFFQRLQVEAHLQTNLDRPFADGYWRSFRLHMIIPPLTSSEPHLALRRHPENPWTLEAFAQSGWAPSSAIDMIQGLIESRKTFLVIGGTGSGKTSVLNACLQKISANDRVICVEDTSEIHLPNHASTKLLSRQDLSGVLRDVDMTELLRQALRMRPDRLIVGEVRGNEARDLLMAFSTGHRGGMSTLHADNPRQGLLRLEMLVQMGAPQWSLLAIRHLIFFGIQYILNVRKIDGQRRLEGIYKLTSLEENGFCLDPVYQIIT